MVQNITPRMDQPGYDFAETVNLLRSGLNQPISKHQRTFYRFRLTISRVSLQTQSKIACLEVDVLKVSLNIGKS